MKMIRLNIDKKHDSIIAWILFNVLRLIPISIFSIPYFLIYLFKSIIHRSTYLTNKAAWKAASNPGTNIDELIHYAKYKYVYKYDYAKGLFDHDSSYFEWIMAFGDCDDIALYAKKALRNKGYKANRIGLIGKVNGKIYLHFDCIFEITIAGITIYAAFNYGNVIFGSTPKSVLVNLGKSWPPGWFDYDTTKYCVCLY